MLPLLKASRTHKKHNGHRYATGDASGSVYNCLNVVCAYIAPFGILGGVIYHVYHTAPAQIQEALSNHADSSDPLIGGGEQRRPRGASYWSTLVVEEPAPQPNPP